MSIILVLKLMFVTHHDGQISDLTDKGIKFRT